MNICTTSGGKTATHQSVIGEAIASIELDDPNGITWLLENYTVAGFQVGNDSCNYIKFSIDL